MEGSLAVTCPSSLRLCVNGTVFSGGGGVLRAVTRFSCAVQQRLIRVRDMHACMAIEQERRLISITPTGVDELSRTYK